MPETIQIVFYGSSYNIRCAIIGQHDAGWRNLVSAADSYSAGCGFKSRPRYEVMLISSKQGEYDVFNI